MAWSFHPSHLKQYKDIAWLLWKYGRSDLVKKSGLDEYVKDEPGIADPKQMAQAGELADDLEKLGPTYVKLGQLLSTRPDLLPQAYVDGLARLQDKLAPFDFRDAEKIISEELGVRLARAFQSVDPVPLAAASIGQVHRAVMRDGRHVVIKVQRPGIRERMVEDLDVLEEVAEFLDTHTEAGRRSQYTGVLSRNSAKCSCGNSTTASRPTISGRWATISRPLNASSYPSRLRITPPRAS